MKEAQAKSIPSVGNRLGKHTVSLLEKIFASELRTPS